MDSNQIKDKGKENDDEKEKVIELEEYIKITNSDALSLKEHTIQSLSNYQKCKLIMTKLINNFKAFCQKYGYIILNCIMVLVELAGIICYIISLKGCTATQTECLIKFSGNALYIIFFLVLSSSISFCSCIILVYNKIIKWYHLAWISLTYCIICFFNFGVNLDNHGAFNFTGFIIINMLLLIIVGIIYFFYWLLKKRHFFIFCAIIGLILLISWYYYFTRWKDSCKSFYFGLGGKVLINNPEENGCYINKPDLCTLDNLNGVFDFSRMIFFKCEKSKNEKIIFLKYLNNDLKNGRTFAYPSTIGYDLKEQINLFEFNKDMLNNIKVIKKEEEKEHEVILHFDENDLGHISINVHRNETLVKERELIRKTKNKKFLYENILFIYIDAFSRNHFRRKMKEIAKFIEQYLYDSSKENNKERVSFQFFKYHSFSYWTHISVAPMFYGATMTDRNGTNIVKYFKENGYITGMTEDYCSKELFDVEKNDFNQYRNWVDWDHENIAMFCDTNYHDRFFPYPEWKGAYCSLRRCLYGRETFEYAIEYAEKFWEAYLNEPKFFRLAFIDAHEGSMEVIKYLDSPLMNMIQSFDKKGWLENTAIIFASDHGDNMFGIQRFISPDFHVEKFLGSLFIVLPNTKDKEMQKQFKNLEINSQRFVSPFDIHDTLMYLLHYYDNEKALRYSETGQTLFEEINGKERVCSRYKDFNVGKCICHNYDN